MHTFTFNSKPAHTVIDTYNKKRGKFVILLSIYKEQKSLWKINHMNSHVSTQVQVMTISGSFIEINPSSLKQLTCGSGQHPYPPSVFLQQVFLSSHMPPSGQTSAVLRPSTARNKIPICSVWTQEGEESAVNSEMWSENTQKSWTAVYIVHLICLGGGRGDFCVSPWVWETTEITGKGKYVHQFSRNSTDKLDFHNKQTQILSVKFMSLLSICTIHFIGTL